MPENYTKITVRIPEELSDEVEKLVKKGRFKNSSELVTLALSEFMENHKDLHLKKSSEKDVVDLELLADDETTVMMEEAIDRAVKDFIKNHIE